MIKLNSGVIMNKKIKTTTKSRSTISFFTSIVLLALTLLGQPVSAITYISAEPIPSGDVVRFDNLDKILSIGYSNLELWSQRLVDDCHIVQNVIKVLSDNRAISTVNSKNTSFRVAAGGFEGVTDPTYVFTIDDSKHKGVSAADVNVLDNALGYVLNQGGTTHFSPDNPDAYEFPLDYAVVTFKGNLTGEEAKEFFESLETLAPAVWNADFVGFTQIAFGNSAKNNSMLFLQPDLETQPFAQGLFNAVSNTPGTAYFPLDHQGQPTTAVAGVSFPGNDWLAFPKGDQYLANLPPSKKLLNELKALRNQHLHAVDDLVKAIEKGKVNKFLNGKFECPK